MLCRGARRTGEGADDVPPDTAVTHASRANAPYSNVSRYSRPQHAIWSPALAVSGRTIVCWQSGHDTRWAIAAVHRPPCSFNLSASPAQFGQWMRSPERAPAATGMSWPQSGQRTVATASEPQQALETPAVETRHDLVAHDDHGHRHPTRLGHQLGASRLVLGDVLRLERHTLLRKKLFRSMAGGSR